jgi:hypothetical protein
VQEMLYVVNSRNIPGGKKVTVVATLEKDFKNNTYTYKPYNLLLDTIPRAKKTVVTPNELPPIAQRRLYSKNRPDIQEILANYGLSHYDEWELLKRTNGRLFTDNLLDLTRGQLDTLKISPDILVFIDENENL